MRVIRELCAGRVLAIFGCVLGGALMLAACGDGPGRNVTAAILGPASSDTALVTLPEMPAVTDRRCPRVFIRDETETLRRYERGGEGDASRVIFQGSLRQVARECRIDGDTVSVDLGVAGHVAVGPRGGAGTYELPIRAAFVRIAGEALWTELYRIPVTISEGQGSAPFAHVQHGIQIRFPEGAAPGAFVIYVGFDGLAGGRG